MRAVAVIAVLAVGCVSRGGGGDDDDDSASEERAYAEQACLELADAFATYDEDCRGARYQDSYDEFIEVAACGDCDEVASVRDRDELEGQCVPWFEEMTCQRWQEMDEPGDLDSSCRDQLQISLFAPCPIPP